MADGIPRADRVVRWAVVALVVACAVHGILAIRGVYADGAFDLYTMFQGRWLLDGNRAFAPIVTQGPAWLGLALGVTNVHVIAVLHSLGVVGVPTALWAVVLVLLIRHRLFWPMVVVFSVVFLNSGLVAVGQYNQLYAYVAVMVALLVRERLGRVGAVALVLLAVLCFRTYEGILYLGPPLAALAVLTWRRRRHVDGLPSFDGPVRLVAAGILLVDAVGGLVIAIFPSDPANRAGALNLLEPFTYDPELVISTLVGLAWLLAVTLLRGRALVIISIVLALVAAVLLAPALWAQPWMHYHTRTTTGLLLLVFLGLAMLPDLRRRDAGQMSFAWIAPAVLVLVQLSSFTASTQGIRNWMGVLEQSMASGSGEVLLADTLAIHENERYAWPWTNPYLSVLFRPQGSDVVILSPGREVGSETIPEPLPPQFHP